MGWSTTLYTGIEFYKETIASKGQAQELLDDTNNDIAALEGKLKSLALMTEPKKFCDDDYDPLTWTLNETTECLEELNALYIRRFKLNLYIENFDDAYDAEKGVFKKVPAEVADKNDDHSYITGDFIKNDGDSDDDLIL